MPVLVDTNVLVRAVERRHPLMRAIRPDKLTLAALGATLTHYLRGDAEVQVPVWRMISATADALERRAHDLAARLGGLPETLV